MKDLVLLLPEIFLAATLAGVVISEIAYHGERVRVVTGTALIGLTGAFAQTLITYGHGAHIAFGASVAVDGLALFFKLFFILLAALVILGAAFTGEIPRNRRAEFCGLVIGTTLAMSFAAAATDLLLAVIALQFCNLLSHFMAGYAKQSAASTEAAVKHLAFASVAGMLMFFGVGILFAATHVLNLGDMHQVLLTHPLPLVTALVSFMLIFLALAFQVGAFPMSLWAPDVLEGAPTPVAAFLSVGPRAAGFAVALRLVFALFAQPALTPGRWQVLGGFDWTEIVGLISATTLVVGSLLAVRQTGAKRLVGCLTVAQSGFLLIGLLVLDEVGMAALLYNLWVDLFALVGAYYVLSFLYDELKSDRLEDMHGMLGRAVPECIALILFLACLVGLPPLPGFIGKFTLIGAAIRHHWYFLAALSIFATILSTVAVARLSFSLIGNYPRVPAAAPVAHHTPRRAFLAALLLPVLFAVIMAEALLTWAGQSLRFILW